MADYIDRQETIDKINERQRKLIHCFGFENDLVKIMDIAKSIVIAIPSAQPEIEPADVVQVVRCENCVHWSDSNQCARPELSGSRWHDAKYFETMPDDFCSYGEREE